MMSVAEGDVALAGQTFESGTWLVALMMRGTRSKTVDATSQLDGLSTQHHDRRLTDCEGDAARHGVAESGTGGGVVGGEPGGDIREVARVLSRRLLVLISRDEGVAGRDGARLTSAGGGIREGLVVLEGLGGVGGSGHLRTVESASGTDNGGTLDAGSEDLAGLLGGLRRGDIRHLGNNLFGNRGGVVRLLHLLDGVANRGAIGARCSSGDGAIIVLYGEVLTLDVGGKGGCRRKAKQEIGKNGGLHGDEGREPMLEVMEKMNGLISCAVLGGDAFGS